MIRFLLCAVGWHSYKLVIAPDNRSCWWGCYHCEYYERIRRP